MCGKMEPPYAVTTSSIAEVVATFGRKRKFLFVVELCLAYQGQE